jgi:hypothetical protein
MNSIRRMMTTNSTPTFSQRWDHVLARWGYRRDAHRVTPGLYALGQPTPNSPVFVTANYTLSFDALRGALRGVDGYILVLDTDGVNVWCAAGKGTFSTEELVRRLEAAGLSDVVNHRRLILPQLGAPGVSAHEVKRLTGFSVIYGPMRAADLGAYLETGTATSEMRKVQFTLWDRLVLVPIELVHVALPALVAAVLLWFLAGPLATIAAVSAILAGAVLFPILLPWLPSHDFSAKGFILGGVVALIFAVLAWVAPGDPWVARRLAWAAAYLLALPPVTAYLALNFTGATPFTSRSGVKREMATYIRPMAILFASGALLALGLVLFRWLGA